MFTATQSRYMDICIDQEMDHLTLEELSEKYEVSISCISTAIRWGSQRAVFSFGKEDKLRKLLAGLYDDTIHLERDIKKMRRRPKEMPKSEWKPNYRTIAHHQRLILDHKEKIAYYEGLQDHVIRIQHEGDIKFRDEPDVSKLTDADLIQLTKSGEIAESLYGGNGK